MFIQRISLTWLLSATVSLLFTLYLVALFVSNTITVKAYQHLNQLITVHESMDQVYRQLKKKAYSTTRMVELNVSNKWVSLDDILEHLSRLEQRIDKLTSVFHSGATIYELKKLLNKIQYHLLSTRDIDDETADDLEIIDNKITILLEQIQVLVHRDLELIIQKSIGKAWLKTNNQKLKDFNTDFDRVVTNIDVLFNQSPNYQKNVRMLFVEQGQELDKLKAIIQKNAHFETLDVVALEQSHIQLQFIIEQFYLSREHADQQSKPYSELTQNIESYLEHYMSLINIQEKQVMLITHNISSGLSNELKNYGYLINLYLLAGAIIALVCLVLFIVLARRRLGALRTTALIVAEGNIYPAEITNNQSNDFLSNIIKAFNLMLKSIAERDHKIQQHVNELASYRQQLEQTVQLRTNELSSKNQQLEAEIQLRKENELKLILSDLALANTSEAVMITDADGVIVEANPAFCIISGYTRDEAIGQPLSLLNSGQQSDAFYKSMWELLNTTGKWDGEIINRRKSGELFPIWETINSVKNQQGKITNYVGVFRDISKLKQSEKELHDLAYYDHLTQLPNRTLFYEYLEHEIANSKRNYTNIAVFFIDLDRFKNVNDTLGHASGDLLLKEVVLRLQQTIRETDIVARQGGDEFLIFLPGLKNVDYVALTAEKIIKKLKAPFFVSNNEVHIGCSIGISIFPYDGSTVEQLVKHSDIAMYHSKENGRGIYKFFDGFMNAKNLERHKIEQRLSLAIENQAFEIYFQPQINKEGVCTGAEALLRWQDDVLGWVQPETFITVAEEVGIAHLISEQVITMVCQHIKDWKKQEIFDFKVSVNLSSKDLLKPNFVDDLNQKILYFGLKQQDIELEITETAILENIEDAHYVLTELSQCNFTIALDDFGTGYSSLAYLHKLPIDRLKIDRSFIKDIPENENSLTITKAIINLAKSMDILVVAEGVESKQQQEFLWLHGCDYCQGYQICKPLPADEFIRFIQSKNAS
jgi:diguanylate cyclase (GGDEF)-like protein/PAS domain S-box-containing protein